MMAVLGSLRGAGVNGWVLLTPKIYTKKFVNWIFWHDVSICLSSESLVILCPNSPTLTSLPSWPRWMRWVQPFGCCRPMSSAVLLRIKGVYLCVCVSVCVDDLDPLAAGGRDHLSPASLPPHQLRHAAESGRARVTLQWSTALSLWRRSIAVCLWSWAVAGEVQRGKHTHTHRYTGLRLKLM